MVIGINRGVIHRVTNCRTRSLNSYILVNWLIWVGSSTFLERLPLLCRCHLRRDRLHPNDVEQLPEDYNAQSVDEIPPFFFLFNKFNSKMIFACSL
ncbi:Uncharacterized protein APZ42_003020 [Daphnia magna]|uniref:Uncharacterized protein n=1 Tax=Daphnia magna TaxID=35525 RepID=A0A164HW46_9CRUS|nr:Uncharacterized protein APZ42_003020 [Daphnia magna]